MTTGHLTAADVCWRPSGAPPWPTSADVMLVGRDALPHLDDDLAIDVVEHLVVTLVDVRDELRAVRATLSASLDLLHREQREVVRLRRRNIEQLDELRALRVAS
jgi:hypothetical protein